MVIWRSVEHAGPGKEAIRPNRISDAEEANWTKLEEATGRTFRERLDVFFENTPQEDLLAFIEDSLTLEDSDDESTGL